MSSSQPARRTPGTAVGETERSLREQVYEELRERIIEGVLAPGARMVERELAEELSVSRVPVREAMQRLETEGFLHTQARRGSVVAEFSVREAENFFDVRESLEALAAGLAAARASAAQLKVMRRMLNRARLAAEAGRAGEVAARNADVHRLIVEMSGNPLLQDLMAPLDGRLRRLFRLTAHPDDGASMCGEHEELYEAIRAGDRPRAEALAHRHVAGTRASAVRLLESLEGTEGLEQ